MALRKSRLYVGLDPQPALLACHAIDEKENIILWEPIYFAKKSSFKTVQDWQEYMVNTCHEFFNKLQVSYSNNYEIVVGIEQQRGRVNSMIEQTLLMLCMILKMKRVVLHPRTWKSAILFKSGKGNYANKEAAIRECNDIIEKKYPHFLEASRLHDLCDARLISRALYNIDKEIILKRKDE